mgnify:CR=1 FL=1
MINLLFAGIILCSIELKSQTLENPNTSPVHTLGTIEKDTLKTIPSTSFDPEWVKDLKLLLPCENINLSKRSSRLPNAPRKYRNGTHRGIDFFANWGTNIRAVAPGVVIRADHHYKEYPPKFREQLLQACGIVGHTPSDIFNNVLLVFRIPLVQCLNQFGKQKVSCGCSTWHKWKQIIMGKPLDGIMSSCFVCSRIVAHKVPIVLHCWSNVEQCYIFIIPFSPIMIK